MPDTIGLTSYSNKWEVPKSSHHPLELTPFWDILASTSLVLYLLDWLCLENHSIHSIHSIHNMQLRLTVQFGRLRIPY